MKVLFTSNIPVPYRIDFFNELGKYVDLTVAYERRLASDRNKEWLSSKGSNFTTIYIKGKEVGADSAFCPEICSIIQNGKFDSVIFGVYHTPTAMLAIQYMKLTGRKYYFSSDGGFVKNDSLFKYNLKRHFISGAAGYFSPGRITSDYLIHYGADETKIKLYPFSSVKNKDIIQKPISKTEKMNLRQKLGLKEQKIILSVGQFIPRKGYDLLIEACNGLSDQISVYIVGGEITDEYKKLIDKYGIKNIHFINFMRKSDLVEYYKASDFFVFPTREDIWGLVVNEAMSYGLPVISTTMCNAAMELIEDGKEGFIVPTNDVIALRDAINKLVDNDDLQEKMVGAVLRKIRKYTIENMVKVHIDSLLGS